MLIGWLLLTWSITFFLVLMLAWGFSVKERLLICAGICLFLLAIGVGAFLITGGK